jgi:molecular chaperone IbpA
MIAQAFETKKVPGFDQFFVGFDDHWNKILKNHERLKTMTSNYPPYNIKKLDDTKYVVEMAVAGFSKEDMSITLEDGRLTIVGTPKPVDCSYIYKGISTRGFEREFILNDQVEVTGAEFVDGMLTINLERIVPEHKKPKKIEIGSVSSQHLLTE